MKRAAVILWFIIIVICSGAETSSLIIKKIEIINNKNIPLLLIENSLIEKEGMEFSVKNLREDLIKLKKSEYIDDAKLTTVPYEKGVKIIVDILEKEDAYFKLKENDVVPQTDLDTIDKSKIVRDIEIFGNKYIKTEDIIKRVSIAKGSIVSEIKIVENKENIKEMGYFEDVISDIMVTESGTIIKYIVLENPVISSIDIEGNTLITKEELLGGFETKLGEIYNTKTLIRDIDRILSKYADPDYAKSKGRKVYTKARIDTAKTKVIKGKITLVINEGTVKNIYFRKKGSEKEIKADPEAWTLLSEKKILEREVVIEKDRPLDQESLQETYKNLFELGYFSEILIGIDEVPDGIKVIFTMDESKLISYDGSIYYGYGTGLALQGTFGIDNLFGKGQKLSLSTDLSTLDKRIYELSWRDQWIMGIKNFIGDFSIFRKENENDVDGYKMNSDGFKVLITQKISRNIEISSVFTGRTIKKSDVNAKDKEYSSISYSPYFTYDARDNFMNPTEGAFVNFKIEAGRYGIINENIFFSIDSDLRGYFKILSKKNILALRLLTGIKSESTLRDFRYNVSGTLGLLGYSSIDKDGGYYYYKNIFTAEGRISLTDWLQMIVLSDIGRGWNNITDFTSLKDLKKDIGLGFAVNTNFGSIRVDGAYPLDETSDKAIKFNIHFGHTF